MSNDYLELSYKSIQCFSNDGKLLVDELDQLMTIALRDGVVDEDEKRILKNIFNRLNSDELTTEMQAKISEIKNNCF